MAQNAQTAPEQAADQDEHRNNAAKGWGSLHDRVRARAEGTGFRKN